MNAASALFYLPGNHLYPPRHLREHAAVPIVMVEEEALCRRRRYHQQKLTLLLAAMREHAEALHKAGFTVQYHDLGAGSDTVETLSRAMEAGGVTELRTFHVADRSLRLLLQRLCRSRGVAWQEVSNPAFMTSPARMNAFFGGKTRVRMADFYKLQRRHFALLLDADQQPEGGRWSFDAENRRKVPARQTLPALPPIKHTALTAAVAAMVAERFSDHPGKAQALWLPTTRAGALRWLKEFLHQRFVGFGTYEDALTTRSQTLFHSTLSPLMNLGLLTPDEVVDRAMQYAGQAGVPLNDVEGFIRQLIGWREFMWGVYEHHGDAMRRANTRGQRRGLTAHWHDGTTGLPPLDLAIAAQQQLGWAHHINRLMVVANLMNLCEIHPDVVYDYFMCHYIDAYDWVMVPNVYGMGLNSDGGVFATKPYICGSNYLVKMSDIPRGPWCDVVDGLYWRFVARHREALRANPRLAAFTSGLDRMADDKRTRIFSAAEEFLNKFTTAA